MNKVYSKIESISGSVITVRAEGVKYNELAEIETSFGTSLAEVNRIDGDLVSLQVFAGGRGVSTGDKIRFLGREMQVYFSENLLGRIFTGSGEPRDKGPALKDNPVEIGGPSVNPSKRIMARRMIRTGIPMIDMFNTLVVSQKLPIFSISGEPYNELLARIAMQAEVDVIVLGGMGLKYDDYLSCPFHPVSYLLKSLHRQKQYCPRLRQSRTLHAESESLPLPYILYRHHRGPLSEGHGHAGHRTFR